MPELVIFIRYQKRASIWILIALSQGKPISIEVKARNEYAIPFQLTRPHGSAQVKLSSGFHSLQLKLKSEADEMLKWNDVLTLAKNGAPAPEAKVTKTDAEWRQQLTGEQYLVTRQAGTERPFSSQMCSLFEPGIYACVCCDTLLFDASEKFESGTGWPSFTQPIKDNAIAYHADNSYGMVRVETVCNTCDAHLGHVFPDGPKPSGLRYCMNAVALKKMTK